MKRDIPFIDLQSQYLELKEKIDRSIHEVLNHGVYINGGEVKVFEDMLCEYTSAKHAITCANGTDALSLH